MTPNHSVTPTPEWATHAPSEQTQIARVVRIVTDAYDREHPPGCPLPLKRDQHADEYGTLNGTLTIDAAAVPDDMRYGLLATTGTHPVVARFSPNAPVPWPLHPPVGLGMKVLNVRAPEDEEDPVLLTQDFLFGAKTDRFFCGSAEDAVALVKARGRGGARGLLTYFFPTSHVGTWRLRELGVLIATITKRVNDPLAGVRYFSQTPISCGPLVVKVAVQMNTPKRRSWPSLRRPDLAARMRHRLLISDAPFTLLFQRQQSGESIDDVRRSWKGPWVPVAQGTFPTQTPVNGEALTITLAHCHPDHETQGPIPRVRIAVYKAISERRHARVPSTTT